MFYQIDGTKIMKVHHGVKPKVMSGSSCFEFDDVQIIRKSPKPKHQVAAHAPVDSERATVLNPESVTAPPVLYGLNKSKLRRKIQAFFNTRRTEKFCAFYSVTFPVGTSDGIAYRLFNTWLTRCRHIHGLQSYVWVSERQKNGTLHFHMLTSTRMPIRSINYMMSAAIDTQRRKNNVSCQTDIKQKYNGIDVDNLYYSKRHRHDRHGLSKRKVQEKLQKYLTKYISKNNTKSSHLPWHCSRDISALFTAELFDEDEYVEIIQKTKSQNHGMTVFASEHYTIYLTRDNTCLLDYTRLRKINNALIDKYFALE
jgi:hypothetical protein